MNFKQFLPSKLKAFGGFFVQMRAQESNKPAFVFLGDMESVTVKSWSVKAIYFANPADKDAASAGCFGSVSAAYCYAVGHIIFHTIFSICVLTCSHTNDKIEKRKSEGGPFVEEKKEKTELEQSGSEINESNAAKRLKLLGDNAEDKIHDDTLAKKKGNFFVELWYRHKWALIVGAVLLFIAIYFIVSMAMQPSYDMYVSYAGPLYVDAETKGAVDFAFGKVVKDYNGDGEKLFNFAGTTYQNEEQRKQSVEDMKLSYGAIMQTSENVKALTNIQTQIISGTVAIFLMDEALYREYESNMLNLEELLDLELDPKLKVGDSGVYFKKTPFFYHMYAQSEGRGLGNLPDDTVLCILPKLTTMEDRLHENSVTLLRDILTFGNE